MDKKTPEDFNIDAFKQKMEQVLGPPNGTGRLFWKALEFAISAHAGQTRKSGLAFISHPCEVAAILVEEMDVHDPEVLAAALLHDTLEDVPNITHTLLIDVFGENVDAIVDGCTKVAHYIGDRQTFRKIVHRKIFTEAASRLEVMLIKLADRLHNLRTLDSMPKHKRQKIAEETLDMYAPMATVMGLYELKRELYHLALIYKFPRQGQKVLGHIRQLASRPEVLSIKKTLEDEMRNIWLDGDIEIRPKGLGAYYDPVEKRLSKRIEYPIELIIKVQDIQSCYRALGIVHQNFPPIPRTIRDFIANPKPSGYRSLHSKANIWGRNYLFKFRTPQMADASRVGILQKWSEDGKVSEQFARELQEMFDILGTEEEVSYRELIAASGKKEIYTYTPKGDRISLPNQSIVLDFAFRVHTEIGERCVSALVGRKEVGPDHVLRDGDRVQVNCQEDTANFDPQLQRLCQTPRARSGLAKIFRARRRALATEVGQSIMVQELRRYGIPYEVLEQEATADILEYFGLSDLGDMFEGIGEGRLRLPEVLYEIRHGLYAGKKTLAAPTGTLNRINLNTLDPLCVKLSHCCNPVPTEKGLLGLLSERGLSVHKKDCRTLTSLQLQREDVAELRWRLKETPVEKPQRLLVTNAAQNQVLSALSRAPKDMRIEEIVSLSKASAETSAWEIVFVVANLYVLRSSLNHFAKVGLASEFVMEQ